MLQASLQHHSAAAMLVHLCWCKALASDFFAIAYPDSATKQMWKTWFLGSACYGFYCQSAVTTKVVAIKFLTD